MAAAAERKEMVADDAALLADRQDAASVGRAEYWRAVCPELHVEDDAYLADAAARLARLSTRCDRGARALARRMDRDGFFALADGALGEDAAARAPAAAAALARARASLSRGAVPHEERFVAPSALGAAAAGERGACIADRAFGALRREAADDDGGGALTSVFWDEQNPNVLSLEGAGGALRERRVTKRSFESPAPQAFGTSEYARVAAAARGGAPLISAERVQARYRWADEDPPREIEGLEISSVFDPSATGFGDLAGAQPLVVVKTRLLFARPISPKGNYYMPTDPRSPN